MVVSKDGDWRSFCENSERLYLIVEIEKALDVLNKAPMGLRQSILDWISSDTGEDGKVFKLIERELEDVNIEVNAYPSFGELDIITWSPSLKEVYWPDVDGVDIVQINNIDSGCFNVTFILEVSISVEIQVELNFSVWDSVDKESVGMSGRTIDVTQDFDVRAVINVNIFDQGLASESIEICEFNFDERYFGVELGEVEVFEDEEYLE